MTRRKKQPVAVAQKQVEKPLEYSFGADMKTSTQNTGVISVYENKNYNQSGSPRGYDVDKILLNKQENIYRIYELMNYYVESDPIFNSIIKKVLTPFSVSSGWRLHGSSEKIKSKFEEYFESIGLGDLLKDVFYEIFLYGQCFLYDRDGQWFDIFPGYRIRIASIGINGQPIIEYKIIEFANRNYTIAKEGFIDTLLKQYEGYPQEVLDGIKTGTLWVQLDPSNTYVLSDTKSRYEKYAMPVGVPALRSFAKKELINQYENGQLNLGQKGFLLINVGDKDIAKNVTPTDLTNVGAIFRDAISGFPMASVAWNVSAKWIQTDSKELFTDKYKNVNSEILSAAGIASIVATGDASNSSFSSAQVNINTLEKRIIQNQRNVGEFIKWIITRRAIDFRISSTKLPSFVFNPINLANDSSFKDQVVQLFTLGLLSRETVLDNMSFDFGQELERKTVENEKDFDSVFTLPPSFNNQSGDTGTTDSQGGNPGKTEKTRTSDKSKSESGKNPKPSTS